MKIRTMLKTILNSLETGFELAERKATLRSEIVNGIIQFFSCCYCLAVVPEQLATAGYDKIATVTCVSITCGLGCIFASYVTNLPFIIAPPTAVTIYLATCIKQQNLSQNDATTAVVLSGMALLSIGTVKPLGRLVVRLIPESIQAATAVGIGLITALAGAVEIGLVVRGKFTLLTAGDLNAGIVITIISIVLSGIALTFHWRGALVYGMVCGTFLWWLWENAWPSALVAQPYIVHERIHLLEVDRSIIMLSLNIFFLCLMTLNGLVRQFADLAGLTTSEGIVPRGNWVMIVCGLMTIISGMMCGPPILISPESASGIKSGAVTGLSTLVCGLLFTLSLYLAPLFASIPSSGTSPLLILVGMLLFQNGVLKVKWDEPRLAIASFMALFLIPFTYSIVCGVGFSYIFYIAIGLFTGDLFRSFKVLLVQLKFSSETASIWRDNAPNYKAATSDEMDDKLEVGLEELPGLLKSSGLTDSLGLPVSKRRSNSVIDKFFPNDLSEQQTDNAFSYLAAK